MQPRKNFITKFGELIDQHRAEQQDSTVSPSRPSRASRLIRWLMPNGGTLILIVLLIATQSVWAHGLQAPTAPGPSATTVNYQGRLADSGGTPINGSRAMTFAIYDAATSGNLIWGPETHAAISVSSGLFSVGLGSQTSGGIPTTTWNGDRYLEISVGGETLSPRELIRSVPIAGMALTVPDGAIGTSQIANGSVSKSKLATDVKIATVKTGRASGDINTPGWTLHQGTGGRSYTVHITFDAPYISAPAVQVSLAHIDLSNAKGERLNVFAQNITNQGFDLVFFTWDDTVVFGASAVWIAVETQ